MRILRRLTQRVWAAERQDDPALTRRGFFEARCLAEKLAPLLRREGTPTFFVSGMLRALQTLEPTIALLGDDVRHRVRVRPDLHEVGGIYRYEGTPGDKGLDARRRSANGEPLPLRVRGVTSTASEIREEFGYNVDLLPRAGQWYQEGWESDADGEARAARIAKWLRSKELHEDVGEGIAVLVMHQVFIVKLLRCLLGLGTDAHFGIENTSTTAVVVCEDGGVRLQWCVLCAAPTIFLLISADNSTSRPGRRGGRARTARRRRRGTRS